jgi:arylsulfatase A-like enzyme
MRVPCLMRWPGMIPAGTTCSAVATVMDLLPTCARLAGADLPENSLDGRDIMPLLEQPAEAVSPHTALPYYRDTRLQAVRMGRWKLWLEHRERSKDGSETLHPLRLYDLATDVGETRDVAADHADVVAAIEAAAKGMRIPRRTGPP